jgi:hypothetical protein
MREAAAMISQRRIFDLQISDSQKSDLLRVVVLLVAMMLFLWAASTSPDLTWRANPAEQTEAPD